MYSAEPTLHYCTASLYRSHINQSVHTCGVENVRGWDNYRLGTLDGMVQIKSRLDLFPCTGSDPTTIVLECTVHNLL